MNRRLFTLSLMCAIGFTCLITPSLSHASDWKRDIALGFNKSSGNTDKASLAVNASIKKTFEDAEFLSKIDIYYAESNGTMDSQEWVSLTRYAFDFTERKKWFNSYQLKMDHDRFANIDYRLLPATGLGYWFARDDSWTLSVEGNLGYEITNYRSGKPDDNEATVIARTFLKKKIFDNATISEDLSIIPSLEGGGTRVESESAFINRISESLDLSIKYLVDYDSEPSAGKDKTDTQIITAIKYSF